MYIVIFCMRIIYYIVHLYVVPMSKVVLPSTDCGPLFSPAYGSVYLLNGTTTFGSVANYSCNPGYSLSAPMSRVCSDTSLWSGFAPVCINGECISVSNI